jgi:hypothetical protein
MQQSTRNRAKHKQRADYTYKHNLKHGRHGWLRLTPAYSVKLVHQILEEHSQQRRVLDPFSGTGTTPLCAAELGETGRSTDINPFLIWLGNTKARQYSDGDLLRLSERAAEIVEGVRDHDLGPCDAPPIFNIQRWWNEPALEFLCRVKSGIDRTTEQHVRDLLLLAFCRTLIAVSNAAFNHQSMSFKDKNGQQSELPFDETPDFGAMFAADVSFVENGARDNPSGEAEVIRSDARDLTELADLGLEPFDIVVTSPPYPNRMSYIRELRPYMYWLGYLKEAREAGELDWEAIGGTWGIATSRLADWKPDPQVFIPDYLEPILSEIRKGHEKNGHLMAQYVLKYFEDMGRHFDAVRSVLADGATVHYIVGNSTFYGNVVPAERLYADMLSALGFSEASAKIIRKRNSKKSLYEYLVSARYGI